MMESGISAGSRAPRISIAVLVGGASSRMGEDKALKRLAGKPLVSHVVEALQPLSDDIFLVGKGAGDTRYNGLPFQRDRHNRRASLVGVYSALVAAKERYCLVVPCDMPFIEPGLARLMASFADGFDAVVPEGPTGWEPLFALYSKSCLDLIARRISEERLKLGELLDGLRVRWVRQDEVGSVCDPARAFFNVNSPGDLVKAQALLETGPGDKRAGAFPGAAPLVCFVGNKNSGKTSFVERLVAWLSSLGLSVACIKHDVHAFTMDREGTDTWRFSAAGAAKVIISAPGRTALLESMEGEKGLDELRELAAGGVDIILVEGFKRSAADKIEVHGDDDPQGLLCAEEELLAVISDLPLPGSDLPTFRHDDVEAVADLILKRHGIALRTQEKRFE